MKNLSAAILIQAVKDLETDGFQEEVMAFVQSKWFEILAEGAGVSHEDARNQVLTGTYNKNVNFRAAYRRKEE